MAVEVALGQRKPVRAPVPQVWVVSVPLPLPVPQVWQRGQVPAPCRCAKTTCSWLGLRELFKCFEEIHGPPRHAGVDARPACYLDGVMEYPAGDFGRAIERDMEREHATQN